VTRRAAGWVVYLLRCRDGTLYTGVTNRLDRRLRAHAAGRGGGYTRARRPVRLVYVEGQPGRGAAQRREAALKRLSRAAKLALVAGRA
jgi:putative endonuclease